MFVFKDQVRGEKQLRLFLSVARRLREVTATLPRFSELPMEINIEAHKSNETLDQMVQHGRVISMSATMPTLPPQQFEVLALRFRPFFAQGEQTNFLSILSLLTHLNESLREPFADVREKWHKAVFWGGLETRGGKLPVETDKIISVGFYSKYFHVESSKIEEAEQYRKTIGAVSFEVALISSVWARSVLVADTAEVIEEAMIRYGQLTKEEADEKPLLLPNPARVQFARGPGKLTMKPLGPAVSRT